MLSLVNRQTGWSIKQRVDGRLSATQRIFRGEYDIVRRVTVPPNERKVHCPRARWWALTVPQHEPAASTTGRVVARCSCSFRRASSSESFVLQHAEAARIIVPTEISDARRSSATTLQHTSRSVTTPTSFRLVAWSTTGAQPQPELRIAAAACAAVSLGPQHDAAAIGSITSLQQPIVISSCEIVGERACATVRS